MNIYAIPLLKQERRIKKTWYDFLYSLFVNPIVEFLKSRIMLRTGGLIIAGLAALAYYKYSKMSEEEKRNMANNIKAKGRKLYHQYVPNNMKNMFAQGQ